MPIIAKELKPAAVDKLVHHGGNGHAFHPVGGRAPGLLLQITAGGGRSWIMRVRIAGKRKHFGLGSYREVPLAEARKRATDIRDAIRTGADPSEAWRMGVIVRDLIDNKGMAQGEAWATATEHRNTVNIGKLEAQSLMFKEAVDEFLKSKLDEFSNDKHRKQWRSTLDRYAVPIIGNMAVDAITVHDMQKVLVPIWTTKTETASRLRGRIENVLAWATVKNHRTGDNPARWKGNLDAILPKPSKVATVTNQPALALDDVAAWWKALNKREGMSAQALAFLTLCASRSGEVRGATWDEFSDLDGDAPLWIIPKSRMKAGNEHRVPLTPKAVQILKALPRVEGDDTVFFAPRGGPLSDMTLSAVMRRMHSDATKLGGKGWVDRQSGKGAVPHGLRSTFRDWTTERTEYPRDMAEIALAHTVGSEVERAYRRGDMLEKRRGLMADWAAFLEGAV